MRNTVTAELTLGCQATELHPFFAIIITTVITVMIITALSFCLTSLQLGQSHNTLGYNSSRFPDVCPVTLSQESTSI